MIIKKILKYISTEIYILINGSITITREEADRINNQAIDELSTPMSAETFKKLKLFYVRKN